MNSVATAVQYEPVIGLEVHIQLSTRSKLFCACSTEIFNAAPNSAICPVCAGLPGVLPVLNKRAVDSILALALALECRVNPVSYFQRKNYFYPDLPKGYQITQHDEPFARDGAFTIMVEGEARRIGIHEMHLEDDAGKDDFSTGLWRVDFNRCGMPLVEVVSAPDLRSPREAYQYLRHMRQLVRYLGISDGDMERGSLRCDANLSLRPVGTAGLPDYKTEIKNLNSFTYLESALEKEIERQTAMLRAGQRIEAWTLRYDPGQDVLLKMRGKESESEYRYFNDPDLLDVRVDEALQSAARARLPELPHVRRQRYIDQLGLTPASADVLTQDREPADYFEATLAHFKGTPTLAANWILNDLLALVGDRRAIGTLRVTPVLLAELLTLLDERAINQTVAKDLLATMAQSGQSPRALAQERNLLQISDRGPLVEAAEAVLAENPTVVQQYLAGKLTVLKFLLGQVMRKTQGRADAKVVEQVLTELLARQQGG